MHTIELGQVSVTRIGHLDNQPLSPAQFFPGTDPALWEANRSWLSPDHWDAETDRVRISVQSWLLRSAGRTILIDTGLNATPTRPGVPPGGDLPAALAAEGVTPKDVDVVICTHLHADHVGWNTRFDDGHWIPTFPNAVYLFSRPDLDFFTPQPEEPARSTSTHHESIAPILRAGQALIWNDTHTLDENLTLSLAPGHTPRHNILTLTSSGDRAVFAGDLLHSPIQTLTPDQNSCFCHDPTTATRTRHRILSWTADHNALLIPAHFNTPHTIEVTRTGPHFTLHQRPS